MRKSLLKAFICVTAVLAIIGLTMIGAAHSGNTDIDEVSLIKSEAAATTVAETTVAPTETQTETTTEATTEKVTEKVTEPTTAKPKPTQTTESKEPVETHTTTTTQPKQESNDALYSASQFRQLGVIHWNGWKWTWYSERVLPGGGLSIPGRHNDANGYVCDENDYICLSSSSLSRGSVIDTPFGKQGKVYDTGCASNVIDVYVGW